MALTDAEIREAYLGWINDHCRQEFTEDNMPGGYRLALEKLIETHPLPAGVASESVADLSRTFAVGPGNELPGPIKNLLRPYRRTKFI